MTNELLLGPPKKLNRSRKLFRCLKCDFITCDKQDYKRHTQTLKHKNQANTNDTNGFTNKKLLKTEGDKGLFKCLCGKSYKHKPSLYNHKKKCDHKDETNYSENDEEQQENKKEEISTTLCNIEKKSETMEIIKEFKEIIMSQQAQISQLITKVGNNNNTTINNNININLYLNENYKDAMNLDEFVDSMKIQLDDLGYTLKNKSLENGICNIFIKRLKDMDISKRPIHCTNLKQKIFYIKDNDGWDKEDCKNSKVTKAIDKVVDKQRKALKTWENEHPDWRTNEKEQMDYMKLIRTTTNTLDEKQTNKIINNIAEQVKLNV